MPQNYGQKAIDRFDLEIFWPQTQAIKTLLENIVRKFTTPLLILCCLPSHW